MDSQVVAWACIAVGALLVAIGLLWLIRHNNEWDEEFEEDKRMWKSQAKGGPKKMRRFKIGKWFFLLVLALLLMAVPTHRTEANSGKVADCLNMPSDWDGAYWHTRQTSVEPHNGTQLNAEQLAGYQQLAGLELDTPELQEMAYQGDAELVSIAKFQADAEAVPIYLWAIRSSLYPGQIVVLCLDYIEEPDGYEHCSGAWAIPIPTHGETVGWFDVFGPLPLRGHSFGQPLVVTKPNAKMASPVKIQLWQDGGQTGEQETSVVVAESDNRMLYLSVAMAFIAVAAIVVGGLERRQNLAQILEMIKQDKAVQAEVREALAKAIPPEVLKDLNRAGRTVDEIGEYFSDQFSYSGAPAPLAAILRKAADILESGGEILTNVTEPLSTAVKTQVNPPPTGKLPQG